jgi:hypothetical protein
VNGETAATFIAGLTARWAGVDPDKPKRGEREILARFGERVMLAWLYLEQELDELRKPT